MAINNTGDYKNKTATTTNADNNINEHDNINTNGDYKKKKHDTTENTNPIYTNNEKTVITLVE